MRFIKTLGLAAMAAMVAMAFVGASTASASSEQIVLCKVAELECKNPYPNPTTLYGHGEKPLALTSIGTIECENSTAEVTLLNQLSERPTGHILTFTLEGNCKLGSTKCAVTVIELGGASAVHGSNPLEAIVTAEPLILEVEGKKVEMHTSANIKCGFFVNCTYTLDGIEAAVTSNEAGEVTMEAKETNMTKSKGICPEIAKMDAIYKVVDRETFEPLTGLYIES
jgi:hypothetical protein